MPAHSRVPGRSSASHCGSQLALEENDALPDCPGCGGGSFRRDSIFEPMQDHGGQTAEFAVPAPQTAPPDWLAEARGAGRSRPAATSPSATTTTRSG